MTKRYISKGKSIGRLMVLLMVLLSSLTAFSQAKTVKGSITDATSGDPLFGVTIFLKGTDAGTISDLSGNFSLDAAASQTLVISYIGYETQEILVGDRTEINVVLAESANTLNEVVVVGYGTQRKRDVTGAIATIKEETLQEVPAPNMLNQLKGRAAGVTIQSDGSTPGSQGRIRIRGNRTLTTGDGNGLDGPLVVVDGIPFGGLNDINPNDIESMEILKDASATAIYGSRGAGGVILITTKRGKVGKPVFSYDGYHGVTTPMDNFNVMNGQEYAQFKADAAKYNRTTPGSSAYLLTPQEQAALDAGISTDWQDLIHQNGYMTNHQLSVAGGVENTRYSIGGGYFNETGILPNQDFSRMTLRATVDQKIGKFVTIGMNTMNNLAYRNTAGGGGITGGLVRLTPLASPYNADGSLNLFPAEGSLDAQTITPLTLMTRADDILDNNRDIRTFNSLYGEVQLLDGLSYRFNAGLNFSQSGYNGYSPPLTWVNTAQVQSSSSATIRNQEYWDVNFQHLLNYNKEIGKHRVGVTGLYEIIKNHNKGSNFNVRGVPADYIGTSNFNLAGAQPTGGGNFTQTGLISYMGRVNYTFNNKYSLTVTMRRDGSSRLSEANRYFNYPAFGASWHLIDEPFMKKQNLFSNLKLRGSWGIAGNSNVGAYSTLGALGTGFYNFGTAVAGQQLGYTVTQLPATDLGWQSTSQVDLGVEFGLLNQRITGSFDYYHQKTKDILLSVSLPASNGAGSTNKNLGRTEGKGVEITMGYEIFRNPNGFNWGVDLIYFHNREKIVQLTTPDEMENIGNGWFVGQPLSVIYDYKKIGIWQTSDAEALAAQKSPVQKVGQIRVEDTNGDGVINGLDRQILGNFQPKWEGGLTSRFSYKGLDASVVIFARMGQSIVAPYLTGNSTGSGGFAFFNQSRVNQMKVDYWTEENPTNDFPAPDAANAVQFFGSTLGYRDGSFIKARSINLGYTFENAAIQRLGGKSARIYLNITNPFILYSPLVKDGLAIDPEGNSGGGGTLGPEGSSGGAPGRVVMIQLNAPPVRQFTFGLNLKF